MHGCQVAGRGIHMHGIPMYLGACMTQWFVNVEDQTKKLCNWISSFPLHAKAPMVNRKFCGGTC